MRNEFLYRLFRQKRGISSLFLAIFLTLFAVILISALFIGLSISHLSLSSSLRIQQDKTQESILIGYHSLTVNDNDIAQSLLVNNTGAITARIRSLYINGQIICDPSNFPGDSYVAPQHTLQIPLSQLTPQIYMNETTLKGNWTVTTERGTKSSDTGENLWLGPHSSVGEENMFYFGPLRLDFNDFKYSTNGGNTWNDAWRVPESASNIIWRINVTDIDQRPIIIKTGSTFSLVQNGHNSNHVRSWSIDTTRDLMLQPWHWTHLYFTGSANLNNMGSPYPISSNFITILGQLIESDGVTKKDFAQTIPFEAVLVTGQTEIGTITTLNAIASPLTVGTGVTISGQVINATTPVPSGSTVFIEYCLSGSQYWEELVQLTTGSGGTFTGQLIPPHAGTYIFRAFFGGASQGQTAWTYSFSANQTILINKAASSTGITINPVPLGQNAVVTANINPSFATGTVTFEVSVNGANPTSLASASITAGRASCSATLAEGNAYTFTAHYLGNDDVLPSDSAPTSLHLVTFTEQGVGADATGTLLTVEGTARNTLPFKIWVCSSGSATFAYPNTISTSIAGKQYAFVSASAVSPLSGTTSAITVTATYKTQYLVTFTQSGLGNDAAGTVVTVNGVAKTRANLPFSVWVDASSGSATYSYTNTIPGATGTRYIKTSADSSPVTELSGPQTVTGIYKAQYDLKFAVSGLDNSAQGTVVSVTVGNDPALNFVYGDFPKDLGFVDSGTVITYSFTSTVGSSTVDKQFVLSTPASTPASGFSINRPLTITGAYAAQYKVTFDASSNIKGDASASAILKIGGNPVTVPYVTGWINSGASVTFTYQNPVASSGSAADTQYVWSSTSGLGQTLRSNTFVVTASGTVTATYATQYKVTFDASSNVKADSSGTIVTVAGSAKTAPNLPFAGWFNSGSSVTYAFSSPVASVTSPSGTQYRWGSTAGLDQSAQSNTLIVSSPRTVTGTYKTQFDLKFAVSGLDSSAQGTIVSVTVDGTSPVDVAFGALPFDLRFVDSGTTVTYSFSSTVGSSTSGKQFVLTTPDASPPFSLSGATTVTGTYKTQYQVSFTQTGISSDASTNTVLAFNDVNYDYSHLSSNVWVDSGTTFSWAPTVAGVSGKQFAYVSTSGLSSPITTSGISSATYKTQFQVSFTQSGISADVGSNTVLTLGTSNYTYDNLPSNLWVDSGTTFAWSSTVAGAINEQFAYTTDSGLASPVVTSGTDSATYGTQYRVSFDTSSNVKEDSAIAIVSISGSDKIASALPFTTAWINAGSSVSYSFYSSVTSSGSASDTQYVWFSTSGLGQTLQSNTFTVNAPGTVTGTYKTQYLVTFGQSGLDTDDSGIVVTVNTVAKTLSQLPFAVWVDASAEVTYKYTNIITGNAGVQYVKTSIDESPLTVNSPATITGSYKTQYYLAVNTPYGTPNGQGWYDVNTNAYASINSLTIDGPPGTRYVFAGWSGAASGSGSPSNAVAMDGAKTATASWITQYQLATSTNFGSVSPITDWYDAGTVVSISANAPSNIAGERYTWNGWTGSGTGSYSTTDNPASITMNGPISEVASWTHEYQLTLNDGGHGSTSGSGWYTAGSTQPFSISETTVSGPTGTQYVFSSWSGDSTSTLASDYITMTGPKTVTTMWTTQYLVQYSTTGAVLPTIVPADEWVNAGNTASRIFLQSVIDGAGTTRCQYVTDDRQSTISGPTTITATYQTQYYLTVNNGGHSTIVGAGWYDAGATAYASLTDGIVYDGSDTRYVFTGWSDDASGSTYSASNGISMTCPKIATSNWQTEYLVTFNINPVDGGSTTPYLETWAKFGGIISILATPTGTYSFINWSSTANIGITAPSDSTTTATINGPGTITANFGV